MGMLESVDLKEFCGVRRCEKPIRLHKFTVLIGPNNSAKTTTLIALFLLPYPKDYCFGSFCALPIIGIPKSLFLQKFLHKDTQSLIYRYSGSSEGIYVFNKGKIKIEASSGGFKVTSDNQTDDSVVKSLGFEVVSTIARYTILIPNADTFREELERGLVNHWEVVEKTRAHVRIIRNLVSRNVVEDKFTEISLRRNELVVRKELSGEDIAYIRLKDLGDGVKKFLTNALWLEAVKPSIVLWDDLESSAHPSLVKEIIEWLSGHAWQVVVSTHSIDVLREVVLTEPEDAIVLALRKLPDDTLTYKEYTLDDLEKMFEAGLDVRKLIG